MNKNHLIYSVMFLFAAFLITTSISCKKDDDSPQTKTEIISGKNFIMTAWAINPGIDFNGTTITDLYSFLDDCEKDDITIFNNDGAVNFDEGATKCDAGDPQTTAGTWMFTENETKLSVTDDGETTVFTIVELTTSKLKISYQVVEDFGMGEETYTNTVTFSAN